MSHLLKKNIIMSPYSINLSSTFSKCSSNFRILFSIILLYSSFSFGQKNNCNATLSVNNNRNTRSTPSSGTYYSLFLTNNSTTENHFKLSSKNGNLNCQNPDNSLTKNNVELKIDFLDESLKPIHEIAIEGGRKVTFFVHVSVPSNTPSNTWSCTEIIASATNCNNYEIKTLLKTLVISSSEE